MHDIFRKLERLGFSLTLMKFVPTDDDAPTKSRNCCLYTSWLKLTRYMQKTTWEKPVVLQWQQSKTVSGGGLGQAYQTPFLLQSGAGDQDDELRRLLNYVKNNQTYCRMTQHMGNSIDEDGGWDICFDPVQGLDSRQCTVYSVGIANDWSFDEAMANYGCDVFSFDPSIHKPSHKHGKKVWFYNFGLMDQNSDGYFGTGMIDNVSSRWKVRTLEGLMAEMDHRNHKLDVLKIDIEGSEWQVLYDMLSRGTLQFVKLLVFEIHLWKPTVGKEKDEWRHKYSVLKWLEQQGFKMWLWREHDCVQVELGGNYFRSVPCCYEQSWLNTRFTTWWGHHSNQKILS
ncbi:putative methyltransferase-like protein 24 [Glandiceps talaboti]